MFTSIICILLDDILFNSRLVALGLFNGFYPIIREQSFM